MAKIDRYTGNLQPFGSNATGTERTVFGDTVQSDTLDGNITADFLLGWEKLAGAKPPKQWFNGAMYTTTQLIAYLHQMGVPEYDAAQEYPINAFANVGGVIYKSLVNSNIGNTPASSPAEWEDILDAAISDLAPNPAVTITGTANALIATPDGTAGALVDGLRIRGRVPNSNTAVATLDYNGTGPLAISNSSTGFLKTGLNYEFEYTSSSNDWQILNCETYWDDTSKEGFVIQNAEIKQMYKRGQGADQTNTHTHPIAFPNVATSATANFASSGNLQSDAYFAVFDPTLTTINIQSGAGNTETVRIIVLGY